MGGDEFFDAGKRVLTFDQISDLIVHFAIQTIIWTWLGILPHFFQTFARRVRNQSIGGQSDHAQSRQLILHFCAETFLSPNLFLMISGDQVTLEKGWSDFLELEGLAFTNHLTEYMREAGLEDKFREVLYFCFIFFIHQTYADLKFLFEPQFYRFHCSWR